MLRNHITIHCWGGYGSQLFAFALAIDIRSRFPKRKIQFRFHSGGVTQRGIEIINDSELNRFSLTNDFKSNRKKPDTLKFLLDFLKVRTILAKSKIIYEDNIFFDIEKIKPWTIQTRGHYSNRVISLETIESMLKSQGILLDDTETDTNKIVIHYRLGDLLTLNNKNYIAVDRIISALKSVGANEKSKIEIVTDSPDESKVLFAKYSKDYTFTFFKLSPSETINSALRAQFFVGTSSKISYWIVATRDLILMKDNFIPTGHKKNIEKFVGIDLQFTENY